MKDLEIYDKYLQLKSQLRKLEKEKNLLELELKNDYNKIKSKLALFESRFSTIINKGKRYLLFILLTFIVIVLIFKLFFPNNKERRKTSIFSRVLNFIFNNIILPFLLDKVIRIIKKGGIRLPLPSPTE